MIANAFDISGTAPGIVGGKTVNVNASGEYAVTYTVTDNNEQSRTITQTVTVGPDVTPPVITPTGSDTTIELTATDTYTEQGGTVTDNDPDYSETATPSGDTPDTSSIGVYTVLYDAPDDAAGNTPDQQSIVITVSDTTPPTFDVDGNTDDYSTTVPFGGTYAQGTIANAFDISGTAPGMVGGKTVNVNASGEYAVTYTVTDNNEQSRTITETVTVGPDVTPPVITVTPEEITLELDSPAPVLLDGVSTDDGSPITISGTVDVGTVGDYTITYSSTDGTNPAGDKTRTYKVTDTTPPPVPAITTPPATVGSTPITIDGTSTEAGATIQLFNGMTPAGTTTADDSGKFLICRS